MGQLPGPSHGHQPERRPRRNGDVGCTPAVRPRPWHCLSASADASGAPPRSMPLKPEVWAGRGGSASPLTAGWTFLAVGLASQSPGGLRGDTPLSVAAACALLASAIEAAAPGAAGDGGAVCRREDCTCWRWLPSVVGDSSLPHLLCGLGGCRRPLRGKSGSLRPGHRPEACLAQMSS